MVWILYLVRRWHSFGCPPGSILGLILFLLYMVDLVFSVELEVQSYADDTTLAVVVNGQGRYPEEAAMLNRDLSSISRWCRMWDMKLNAWKTKSTVVERSRTLLPHHPVLWVG